MILGVLVSENNTITEAQFPRKSLEGVMNFIWEAIASWHGDSKTIPKRCFRRRVGLRSPVSGARSRRRTPAHPRVARGLERTEVGGENRLCLALYATRPSAVG